jgi:hypothetical protein
MVRIGSQIGRNERVEGEPSSNPGVGSADA